MQQGKAGGSKFTTELKVSGHLMTFDAGLFVIFTPPGSPAPDPATGLPGIRVSLPPGPAFRPEAVTISTFREDGWLGGWNGAALVRVARGPAQVVVTIYQAPQGGEAPKLQIMRLAEGQPAAATRGGQAPGQPQPVAAPAPALAAPAQQVAAPPAQASAPVDQMNTPSGAQAGEGRAAAGTEIVAHIQARGDVSARLDEWMGKPGSKQWVEGFSIAPKQRIGPDEIEYQAVLGRGWLSPWAEGGQFCGSRGMSLPILGLRVRLRGEAAERFDCVVTATFVDGTKVGPMDSGEPAQAESLAPLEAFKVDITPRGEDEDEDDDEAPAAKPAAKASAKPAPKPAAAPPRAPAKPAPAKPEPKPAPKAPARPSPAKPGSRGK